MNKYKNNFLILVLILSPLLIFGGSGTVYLVLGSDTGIWDGMDTRSYHCTYNPRLFTYPSGNANAVMDPNFRDKLKDSYGNSMKLTWWMMAGNIFRYATNTNVPHPNLMTISLMKKHYSEELFENGDELSLHYHTFKWSDYNNDGRYYWNQARSFQECRSDFNYTLSQLLLEEKVFPVSFRSGWHYMDNEWQNYLNKILPYSMHNAYPSKKTEAEDTEPYDNIIDWSQAPSEFKPYHPSADNYQVKGNTPGWNLRSAHFNNVIWKNLMDTVFAAAAEGEDQMACFWGHLPENDFKNNLENMDSLAHAMETKYPEVDFRYCTAIEAMQRWQNSTKSSGPEIDLRAKGTTEQTYFEITSTKSIFQPEPYVAIKTIKENYKKIACRQIEPRKWETKEPLNTEKLAKIGVAACDSLGNQSLEIKKYLPEDNYIDNSSNDFSLINGDWNNLSKDSKKPWQIWGENFRIAYLDEQDSASARWIPEIKQDGRYNIFYRVPPFKDEVDTSLFLIKHGNQIDTIREEAPLTFDQWNYITTTNFNQNEQNYIKLIAKGPGNLGADAIKVSPLVQDYDLQSNKKVISPGEVSIDDTITIKLSFTNSGVKKVLIEGINSREEFLPKFSFPHEIPPMSKTTLELNFSPDEIGKIRDTISIASNDPDNQVINIPTMIDVVNYFKIVDNSYTSNYHEYGDWEYSNAYAYGSSSRYVFTSSNGGAYATFTTELKYRGSYDIYGIVPETENAADHALYILSTETKDTLESVIINQNNESGNWVKICRQYLPCQEKVKMKILDDGNSSNGRVLRADAIKFDLVQSITNTDKNNNSPTRCRLKQNYPNPFNSTTTIKYILPKKSKVNITIYDIQGKKVQTLVNKYKTKGKYKIKWNASNISSGVYFYRIKVDNFNKVKKCILIK